MFQNINFVLVLYLDQGVEIINMLELKNGGGNDSYNCWYHSDDVVYYIEDDGMYYSDDIGVLCDNLDDNINDDIDQ